MSYLNVVITFVLCIGSTDMAEWKYDPLDRDDENGEDDESTSSVSLYVTMIKCYNLL